MKLPQKDDFCVEEMMREQEAEEERSKDYYHPITQCGNAIAKCPRCTRNRTCKEAVL